MPHFLYCEWSTTTFCMVSDLRQWNAQRSVWRMIYNIDIPNVSSWMIYDIDIPNVSIWMIYDTDMANVSCSEWSTIVLINISRSEWSSTLSRPMFSVVNDLRHCHGQRFEQWMIYDTVIPNVLCSEGSTPVQTNISCKWFTTLSRPTFYVVSDVWHWRGQRFL